MNKIYRIIDANLNRIAEGLRVIEDITRFHFENPKLTQDLRSFRHEIRKKFVDLDGKLISSRDSTGDIGKKISRQTQLDHKNDIKQLVTSSFKRVEEGLRTIEENLKVVGEYNRSKEVEKLRFSIYTTEKKYSKLFIKALPAGIYGITAEKFSRGRSNIDVVKEMIKGGVKTVQYREKHDTKSIKQIYEECCEIRNITRGHNILLLVNDYVDIAMAVDADGVHVGQDDLPIAEVRKLVGEKIIGLSTHSPEQAQRAVEAGADYIGVGPIFKTDTKESVCDPVGIEYLEYAVANVPIPFVAIGGIKEHNVHEIKKKGAKTICLVTDIVGADNIAAKVEKIRKIMMMES